MDIVVSFPKITCTSLTMVFDWQTVFVGWTTVKRKEALATGSSTHGIIRRAKSGWNSLVYNSFYPINYLVMSSNQLSAQSGEDSSRGAVVDLSWNLWFHQSYLNWWNSILFDRHGFFTLKLSRVSSPFYYRSKRTRHIIAVPRYSPMVSRYSPTSILSPKRSLTVFASIRVPISCISFPLWLNKVIFL